jgi:hypothetical protein
MEKDNHENIDVRGTLVLTFLFLAWFAFLWLLNMGMLLQVWPVK